MNFVEIALGLAALVWCVWAAVTYWYINYGAGE